MAYFRSIPGQNSPVLATMAGYTYIVDRHRDQIAAAGRGNIFKVTLPYSSGAQDERLMREV